MIDVVKAIEMAVHEELWHNPDTPPYEILERPGWKTKIAGPWLGQPFRVPVLHAAPLTATEHVPLRVVEPEVEVVRPILKVGVLDKTFLVGLCESSRWIIVWEYE